VDNNPEKHSIVIDGAHFFNKSGTGIASYARTLASTLRRTQCSLSVLYGRKIGGRKHLSDLAVSTQLFGEAPTQRSLESFVESIWLKTRVHLQRKLAATAIKVDTTGVDLSAFDPPLPLADTVLNVDRLYLRANHAFAAKRRLTEITLPERMALAHWTSPLAVKAKGAPNVYTLHDLIPLQFPYFVYDKDGRGADLHAAIARDADLIITVSEASKQAIVDLLKLPPERVHVTYQPTPSLPSIPREEAERLVQNLYGVRAGEFALFLGAMEPKKNLKRLIEAHLLSGVKIPLLIAGPRGWLDTEEHGLINSIARNVLAPEMSNFLPTIPGDARKQSGPVRHLGFLPRWHVIALLQCARFFAFPSICEGFGLPVLEAMQLGVPVLTSNTSSLPEVAGDAAVLADPLDVADMTSAVRTLTHDKSLCEELARRGPAQARKFNGDFYRERLAAAYKKVGVTIPVGAAQDESDIAMRTPLLRDRPLDHASATAPAAASSPP
jgi:glycosyltransferase involved in cell wall biosynthesis